MFLGVFFSFLFFGAFSFLFFTIPGFFILSLVKEKLSSTEKTVLGTSLGFLIFTLISFLLSFLKLRFLVLPVVLFFVFLFFKKKLWVKLPTFRKILSLPVLVISIGALAQSLLLLKSGLPYQGGLAFWGVHGYDGIWHTSLIAEIVRTFPPQNPGFPPLLLKNYHFLTDLLMAQTHLLTRLPIINLYFRFFPLFFAFLLNGLVYLFTLRWSGRKDVALLAIFWTSLAGSFGWILPRLGMGSNNWETAFWGIQPPSAFVNPPFGVSLIVILTLLILLDLYFQKKEKILFILTAMILGLLVGFKIYGFLVFILALGLVGLWQFLKKKDFSLLAVCLAGGLISLGIYLPFSQGSTSFLVFQPGWFLRTMIQAPDRVNWRNLELRWQTYSAYHDFFNLSWLIFLATLIFLFGNLSARFLGFFVLPERIKNRSFLDKILLLILILSFLPPLLFIQKAVPWNSIQFLYYFTFFFSFLAALTTAKILIFLKKKIFKIVFLVILIAVSLPSSLETLYWFNAPVPTTLLGKEEVEALSFLKKNSRPEDLILTYPYGELQIKHFPKPPVPMTYYNSPYVSFFSNRRVYLEDQNAAIILGYPWEERLSEVKTFFKTEEEKEAREFLDKRGIDYLYLVSRQDLVADKDKLGLNKIFENGSVRIFKVK